MEPRKDLVGQRPLISNLLALVGRDQPNFGQIGNALLEMSRAIIDGVGDTGEIDRLRRSWSSQTRNGSDTTGSLYGEAEVFQKQIQEIAKLKKPYDSYAFYVPGGSGIIRVEIWIDGDGKPKAHLADYGGTKKAKENFDRLF